MRRLSLALIAAVSALAFTQIASAADLPRKAPAYMPPPVPVYNWTGFYIGGNIGAHIMEGTDLTGDPANAATAAFWGPCFTAGACPRSYGTGNETGVIGGGQIGYNWQIQNWVVGFEADFQGSSAEATGSVSTSVPPFAPFTGTSTNKVDWLGTVRARAGILVTPMVLAYMTGGWAYGHVQQSWTSQFGAPVPNGSAGSSDSNSSGWTIGGGVEWALGNHFTVSGEYLFVHLDGEGFTANNTGGPGGTAANSAFNVTGGDFDNHIIRAKVNYKF